VRPLRCYDCAALIKGALCAGIPLGGGRVTSRLAENAGVLSPPCYGALSALGAIRGSHSNQPSAGIPIEIKGGTFIVPVTINGQITLKFVIDSGATDVAVPADVVLTLIRTGSIMREDSLGQQRYRLADGSVMPSPVFRIRSLKVGDKVLKNVRASVASVKGSLLLGQSFLNRFNSWSVDNKNGLLFLN
jgi:clan AA aspartic protease (TIGR02281 family)